MRAVKTLQTYVQYKKNIKLVYTAIIIVTDAVEFGGTDNLMYYYCRLGW